MKKQHFTLIELLVVIGIIIVLTGILIPAVNGSMKKAENTKCKAEMATLLNALIQYESTYGVLPVFGETDAFAYTNDQYAAVIKILQGDDSETVNSKTIKNPRKIKFLDVKDNEEDTFTDPWGNNYQVVVDASYQDLIPNGDGSSTILVHGLDAKPLHYGIFIWSKGADGESNATLTNKSNKDNVYGVSTVYQKENECHIITK